jgi:peptidyl-tRNA hydrolase, PTH1 family
VAATPIENRTRLILGLGNPGPRYRSTRHNMGFLVVADLASRHGLNGKRRRSAQVWEGTIRGRPVVLAQPQTMMNASGNAAVDLRRAYNVHDLANLLVVYDELDLSLGVIRMRDRGSSGGHNGMKSIIERLGTQEFARLRIGIGRPPPGEDPIDYVLTTFRPDERPIVERVLRDAADAVESWVALGPPETMNRFNRAPSPDIPPSSGEQQ